MIPVGITPPPIPVSYIYTTDYFTYFLKICQAPLKLERVALALAPKKRKMLAAKNWRGN